MEGSSGQTAFAVKVKWKFLHQPHTAWQDLGIYPLRQGQQSENKQQQEGGSCGYGLLTALLQAAIVNKQGKGKIFTEWLYKCSLHSMEQCRFKHSIKWKPNQ